MAGQKTTLFPSRNTSRFMIEDFRKKYRDGVTIHKEKVCLYRQGADEEQLKTRCLPRQNDQIMGQGFHHMVVSRLEEISAGEMIHVHMILPARLDQYAFRIRKRRVEGDTPFIRLEVESWLLRLFAQFIDAEYSLRTKRLLRYQGLSNIADSSGKLKTVDIRYSYNGED
jgi:hypothetical protein